MSALLQLLRKRGWIVREANSPTDLLPPALSARYPRVPAAVTSFLGRLEVCHNAAEDVWMLTPADFRATTNEGFRWNEYELMALDGASDEEAKGILAFWNDHLPIMMAVHSDYDYFAVRVAEPGYGSIVHGASLEWESPSPVASSFDEFLAAFAAEASSSAPEYPYSIFLLETG